MDLLSGGDMMVQLDGIGTPSTERVARIQGCCELKLGHKRPDIRGGVFETFPFTFPHLNDRVPLLFVAVGSFVGWSRRHLAWSDQSDVHGVRGGLDNTWGIHG